MGLFLYQIQLRLKKSKKYKNQLKRWKVFGLNVKFGKYAYENPLGYGETAKHKAEDLNEMFKDKSINRHILYNAVGLIVILFLII